MMFFTFFILFIIFFDVNCFIKYRHLYKKLGLEYENIVQLKKCP